MTNKENPKNITRDDRVVGVNIYLIRTAKNISRVELAKHLGITHQQLQKYEKGYNRLTVGRLMDISDILGEPIEAFFATKYGGDKVHCNNNQNVWTLNPTAFKFIHKFNRQSPEIQNSIITLLKACPYHY